MADKSIGELIAATQITESDLFVLEQSGTAKKMTGQIFVNWLTHYADGHGGIQSITKTTTAGLVDTYRITFADTDAVTFTVTNGKGISSITQYWAVSSSNSTVPSSWQTTRQTMTVTNRYLWSYMRIAYNDGSNTDTTKSVVGVYGDTGAQTYVWIKYSSRAPISDSDLGDDPDSWIGIHIGTEPTAPTNRASYKWYKYKGETGETGVPATLENTSVSYQIGENGTTIPEGSWTTSVPPSAQGKYLWTRVILQFNSGNPITYYSVAHYGLDGTGAVSSVNGQSPDSNGNVNLSAIDVQMSDEQSIQNHVDNLETNYGKINNAKQEKLIQKTVSIIAASTSTQIGSIEDAKITSNTQVVHAEVEHPSRQTSPWTITTYDVAPQLRIVGTCSAATTVKLILAEIN